MMKFVEITLHWRCTSVRFSIQPTRTPARPRWSARGTRAVGRSVSRWYQISMQFSGAQISSLGRRALVLTTSTKYTCGLSI